eukprot:m.79301 g.79301  ORF g.79301 m.79301 type:complete len:56 (-) comp50632_c0_seq3:488-655(-)
MIVAHILEMGIIMHSILIGINLGTTTDPETLHPLLIAVRFHCHCCSCACSILSHD